MLLEQRVGEFQGFAHISASAIGPFKFAGFLAFHEAFKAETSSSEKSGGKEGGDRMK